MSEPESGGGKAPTGNTAAGAAASVATAGDGAASSELVMRQGKMKKAFAPKIPGARKAKPTAAAAPAADAAGTKGKGKKDKGGRDRPRSGKGPKSYSQGQGVFSQGFGTDQVPKPKKASVRLPASGKRTDFSDIRVKKESVDEMETSSSIKRGKSSKAAMDVDGFSKFEPPSSSDEEDGAGGDPASLFPHTEEEALPIRLPLGSSQHSTAHDDVSDFPQPPPGKADFVFLQLPTLAPDIEAQDRNAPVDEMTVDTEEEVVSLAEALAGKQDGQIGTLRIRASGKAELVLGDDVYMFQKGTSIDCVQNVATVHTGEGKMVCLGTVPPEQRYLVIRDLNKAMADLDTSGSRN